MSDDNSAAATRILELSQACQRILRDQGPAIQSGVLADLLSLWLAGHCVVEEIGQPERPETDKLREEILAALIELVRELVPTSEKEILQRAEPKGRA